MARCIDCRADWYGVNGAVAMQKAQIENQLEKAVFHEMLAEACQQKISLLYSNNEITSGRKEAGDTLRRQRNHNLFLSEEAIQRAEDLEKEMEDFFQQNPKIAKQRTVK